MNKFEIGELLIYNCNCGATGCRRINDTFFIFLGLKKLVKSLNENEYIMYSFKNAKYNVYPEEDLKWFTKIKKRGQKC